MALRRNANFQNADFQNANFQNADFQKDDFQNATPPSQKNVKKTRM
jgi:uncharacterized protein YjbI with pentapeptide repeats